MLLRGTIMILVFALAGTFTATLAGVTALIMGQSWWIGLASYIASGMLTVFILVIFTTISLKGTARKTDTSPLQTHMPLADH